MWKPQLLEDLAALVAVPSVMDPASAEPQAPFGTGVRKALTHLRRLPKKKGFRCGTLTAMRWMPGWAKGRTTSVSWDIWMSWKLGIRRDGTVIPFVMRQDGDLLYGRGVNDDKGPLLAALYAAWLIREQDCRCAIRSASSPAGQRRRHGNVWHGISKRSAAAVRIFTGWQLSIVNGEKGILQVRFLFPKTQGVTLASAKRANFVCDDLLAELPFDIAGERAVEKTQEEAGVRLHYKGKSARHAIRSAGTMPSPLCKRSGGTILYRWPAGCAHHDPRAVPR